MTIDACVAIDLSELGCLELLGCIFRVIYIPELVLNTEIQSLKPNLSSLNPVLADITSIKGWEFFHRLKDQFPALSDQDRLVITISYETNSVCISNDATIRKACERHHIWVSGLLGVLGCARTHNVISQDKLSELISSLDNTGCYISADILWEFKKHFGLSE